MTDSEILDSVKNGAFHDYYGRILRFNPKSNDISLYLDGGSGEKTENHLSQPDGLTILKLNDKSYIVINEDLNGKSMGRVPSGVKESICEVYMIDMDKNPTIDNLTSIAVVPEGAEVTGACATPDGKSLLFSSQHPNLTNNGLFKNSLSFALRGFDKLENSFPKEFVQKETNILSTKYHTIRLAKKGTFILLNKNGLRVRVFKNTDMLSFDKLPLGTFNLKDSNGETRTVVIQ